MLTTAPDRDQGAAEAPLKAKIIDHIKKYGPLTVEEYMDLCLFDEEYGYYQRQTVFGAKGDFTTAPEISQMFGEILAIWLLINQQILAQPNLTICEIGPGRAILMLDMLRAIRKLAPPITAQMEIYLIEKSANLRQLQQATLEKHGFKAQILPSIDHLPAKKLIIIANELLDALAIRQFYWQRGEILERLVSYDQNQQLSWIWQKLSAEKHAKLAQMLPAGHMFSCPDKKRAYLMAAANQALNEVKEVNEKAIIELSPQRSQLIAAICQKIKQQGTSALFIDYGSLCLACGDSLQSVKNHKFSEILKDPGQSDITSHVDFASLSFTAAQHGCYSFAMEQGAFLTKLAIIERAQKLAQDKSLAQKQRIYSELARLIEPQYMGQLFKIFFITAHKEPVFPFSEKDLCQI